ncbi:MAG: cytochrome P450 [Actinobacteria bacterium]|nr:cytochrome P450 [Actinomycetota bacterium]
MNPPEQTLAQPTDEELLPWGDPEFRRAPWPWFARLVEQYPIVRLEDGSYVVTGYDLVVRHAKDRSLVSVSEEDLGTGPWAANDSMVLRKDGEEHTALRRTFAPFFTLKAMDALVEAIADQTRTSLDEVGQDGILLEAHRQLGVMPQMAGIAQVMGLPLEDASEMVHATNLTMMGMTWDPSPDDVVRAYEGFGYMLTRVDTLIRWKREHRGDGSLVDHWLTLIDEGKITERSVKEHLQAFWAGAGHNPGYVLACALVAFDEHPGLLAIYRDEPAAREPILDEVIRLAAPELALDRYTTEPLEIGGMNVPTGASLRFILGAALRDPAVFENPDQFDHRRPKEANMGIAFGLGRHTCPGMNFARVSLRTALTCVAERYEKVEVIGEPDWKFSDRHRNCEGITVRFLA